MASSVPRSIGLKDKNEHKEASREGSPKFSSDEVSFKCIYYNQTINIKKYEKIFKKYQINLLNDSSR